MNSMTRTWRTWRHGRKLARKGSHFRCPARDLTIDGHVEMGQHCRFRENVVLRTHGQGRILFGNRTGMSWHCHVEASELVSIGSYTGIAEQVLITDTVLDFMGNHLDWREVPRKTAPVHVGDEAFVGCGCFIGPGVTIGNGAVVAHHSVVVRDIGPYEIWAGAPARKMGHRTEGVPEARLEELRRMVAEHGIQEDRYSL